MKTKLMTMLSAVLLMSGCGQKEKVYDATGTFEATETIVSAEQGGQLLSVGVNEGDSVACGQLLALVDTTQLYLQLLQLQATKTVYASQQPDIETQLAATRQQIVKARSEVNRYSELVADGAAPRKMLDDAESQLAVLQRQLSAQQSALSRQQSTLHSQQGAVDAQTVQVREQMRRCRVVAPVAGTVLSRHAEPGEMVVAGKPLFTMADTRRMYLRAYVTSAQLQHVRLGQTVQVFADYGGQQRQAYEGTVTWVSSRSEFTPKSIQTDDERADLVYAVKIAVANDGYIKIGMYGEVKF